MSMSISGLSGTASLSYLVSSQQSQQSSNPLINSLASTLGMSGTQIEQQLDAGSTLSQIATNQGVPQSTLLSAVESSLSDGPGQGLSSTQLSSMANNIINQVGMPEPPAGGPQGPLPSDGSSSGDSSSAGTDTDTDSSSSSSSTDSLTGQSTDTAVQQLMEFLTGQTSGSSQSSYSELLAGLQSDASTFDSPA